MKLNSVFLLLLLLSSLYMNSQPVSDIDTNSSGRLKIILESLVTGTSQNKVPFWMRTNSFGSNPLPGISGSLLLNLQKNYGEKNKNRLADWGVGMSGRVNAGKKSEFLLIEGYVKGRLSIFQLKAGRSKDFVGLADSSLSAGPFSIAGNSLGIPKIELSVPEYWYIPYTNKLLAFKGSFSHGWFGSLPLSYDRFASSAPAYYHQKSLYGRLGKPNWAVKFYGGVNHQVMWSDGDIVEGRNNTISLSKTFWYVVRGKTYSAAGVPKSKIGNHLGSLDQGLEVELNKLTVTGYHQFFYEVGGLYYLNNIKDGLWGLSIKNKKKTSSWKKLLVEILYSKSQGGEPGAPTTPSGDEDYYNNYIYAQGWTYQGENLGNNFLTNKKYMRTNLPTAVHDTITNNRILLFHTGGEGTINRWYYRVKLSFSRNFGTYGTSPIGNSTGPYRSPGPPPYFTSANQFSGYAEAGKSLKHDLTISFAFALDAGSLLYNSAGTIVKLTKHW